MGQLEPTVKLLLECEPEEDNFLADQHLACLISTLASQGAGAAEILFISTMFRLRNRIKLN
jgi:hypothetical protein